MVLMMYFCLRRGPGRRGIAGNALSKPYVLGSMQQNVCRLVLLLSSCVQLE